MADAGSDAGLDTETEVEPQTRGMMLTYGGWSSTCHTYC